MKLKVLAYIIRKREDKKQLLVFTHRDYLEAGLQIPAGTIEAGEEIEQALFREIEEESGLTRAELKLKQKLAVYESQEWQTIRHVFHLELATLQPETWEWLTNDYHDEAAKARDERLVFCYRWDDLPLKEELAGAQGMWLNLIT